MATDTHRIRVLVQSMLAGRWRQSDLIERVHTVLDGGPPIPSVLVERILAQFGARRAPHPDALTRALRDAPAVQRWLRKKRADRIRSLLRSPTMEQTPRALGALPIPALTTLAQLAEWLDLTDGELAWYADVDCRQARATSATLRHYRFHWQPTRHGAPRLIEAPKDHLKLLQRRILTRVLEHIPVHPAAHGFQRGRSCLTYVEPHVGRPVVARFDLERFFLSVTRPQVVAVFRTLGYPDRVAASLAGLCTIATDPNALPPFDPPIPWTLRRRFTAPHLPQGAPTSPTLANLCAWRLDLRLAALADSRGLAYTRYADDLAFSAGRTLEYGFSGFRQLVKAIVREQGFRLNGDKTRLMRSATRQRLGGMIINAHPNVPREDFDQLKAILTNCVRHGPESQNREGRPDFRAHLQGRIAYVTSVHPRRGHRLAEMFDRIAWKTPAEG